jgi:RNA polymerase sigma-70 factor (ECF subfamily)
MTDFNRALTTHLAAIRPLARYLARNQPDADDLIQETAERALLARDKGSYVETGKMREWLICILYNRFKRMKRNETRNRVVTFEWLNEIDVADEFNAPAAYYSAVLEDMRAALERIRTEHSSALLLDALGFSYDEIAERHQIPMGTVKSRLNRAREKIRAEVEGVERVAA